MKITPRGNIKPIQLGASENVLFDFSSNLPPNRLRNVRAVVQPRMNVELPHSIANYIKAYLDMKNISGNPNNLHKSIIVKHPFGAPSAKAINDGLPIYRNIPKTAQN